MRAAHPSAPALRKITQTIAAILALVALNNALAIAKTPHHPLDPIELRHSLSSRGIGKGIKITEADGTRVVGILTAIKQDSFDLTPRNTFHPITISYAQVVSLRKDGNGMGSAAAKFGSAAAIGAGTFSILVLVLLAIAMHG